MAVHTREITLLDLGIDNKLRGCDLVRLMVRGLAHGSQVLARATGAPAGLGSPSVPVFGASMAPG
jgi:hypothetical protein